MESIPQNPDALNTDRPVRETAFDYFVDTHAHLFDGDFDPDREQVIERAREAGVRKIILPAVDSRTYEALLKTADQFPDTCYPAIGLHPTSLNDNSRWRDELRLVREQLKTNRDRYCAIGEVGLDLHWSTSALCEQSQALAIQAELSIEYGLPLILHVRDAWNEIIPLLEPLQHQIRGVFHSFQGTIMDYHRLKELGDFAVGIGGFITYKNSTTAKVLEEIPLEDIVLETDAPYLTPIPHRGTRNESAYIPVIATKVAEIKGVTVEEVMEKTTRRAYSIFFDHSPKELRRV